MPGKDKNTWKRQEGKKSGLATGIQSTVYSNWTWK